MKFLKKLKKIGKKPRALTLKRSFFKKVLGKFKYSRTGWRLWKKVLIWGGLSILFIIFATFAWFAKDLPTPGNIKSRQVVESTQIFDRKGNLLYTISGEQKRTVIDFDAMPQNIKDATLAAEDKTFYHHLGINFKGIFRAVYYNVFLRKSGNYQGGSTITQQFVKNALLSPKQTITRKIKEIILSLELEMMYSKDDILAFYLNEIPYGSNAYGIQAASEIYFGKDAKDLTLAQAATIAALAQAPTYYSPYGSHVDELKWRRNWVLDEMVKGGSITEDEATAAQKTKMKFEKRHEYIKSPHFVMYVKEWIAEKYGDRMVEEGGLKVYTTLDPTKQKIAESSVRNGASRNASYGASNAALVSINPKNGDVLAMVGSKDYWSDTIDGQVNVATAKRQPGSAFKPIVYATAFKSHWAPASTLFDVRTDFGGYTPNNYDLSFRGPISIREALAQSKNIPAVKMLYLAGIKNSIKTAEDMGITTLTDPDRYGLALVLGGGEIKLVELTGAYSVFAASGTRNDVNPILKIVEPNGNVLEEKDKNAQGKEVIDPQIAYEISSILSDNNARAPVMGSNSALRLTGRTAAAKTGTTDGYRDAWTVGYTPSIVTGVWVGNNSGAAMRSGAAGVLAAAPIWNEYMRRALGSKPNEEFSKPNEIKTATVDALTGKLPSGKGVLGTRTDIFTDWQMPKERASQYTTVKICRACSGEKLAGDDCPSDLIVEKTYANVHSEVPEKSNWENPVRAWAKAHGLGSVAPTEVCNLHGKNPTITITSPSGGESVSGNTTVSTSISAPLGVSKVVFYADGVTIGTDYSSPYSLTYNMNNLSEGTHTIKTTVIDRGGLTDSDSVLVNVLPAGAVIPAGWSSPALSALGSGVIRVKWTVPSDPNFSKARIYFRAEGESYSNYRETVTSPIDISGFQSNTWYYFIIKSIDINGAEYGESSEKSVKAK